MANAKKCDRCGKFYDTSISRAVPGFWFGVTLDKVQIKTINDNEAYTRDLCDECMDELLEFLKVKEK